MSTKDANQGLRGPVIMDMEWADGLTDRQRVVNHQRVANRPRVANRQIVANRQSVSVSFVEDTVKSTATVQGDV